MGTQSPESGQMRIESLFEIEEGFRDRLVNMAKRITGTDEDAEDAVHDVVLKALLRDPDEIRDPKAYLNRACWTEAKGTHRKKPGRRVLGKEEEYSSTRKRAVRFDESSENIADEADKWPDRKYEEKERDILIGSLVRDFCNCLKGDPRRREAFALRIMRGWSYERIAKQLQVPEATVGTWIFRATEAFRRSKAFSERLRTYTGQP